MQKIRYYDIIWNSDKNLPSQVIAKDIPFYVHKNQTVRKFNIEEDSKDYLLNAKGATPIKFKWERLDVGWFPYKFAKTEAVYCPYLDKIVEITNHQYAPIWCGAIDFSYAPDFWEKNWEGCGLPKKEVINSGWPWNYSSLKEARTERLGVGAGKYGKDKRDYEWGFYHENTYYRINMNGKLADKAQAKAIGWPKEVYFVEKLTTQHIKAQAKVKTKKKK